MGNKAHLLPNPEVTQQAGELDGSLVACKDEIRTPPTTVFELRREQVVKTGLHEALSGG